MSSEENFGDLVIKEAKRRLLVDFRQALIKRTKGQKPLGMVKATPEEEVMNFMEEVNQPTEDLYGG